MIPKPDIDQIKSLIRQNKLEDAFKALESLEENLVEEKVIIQQQRYSELRNLQLTNRIRQDDASVEKSDIIANLLEILDLIEHPEKLEEPKSPVIDTPSQPSKDQSGRIKNFIFNLFKKNYFRYISIMIMLVILVGGFFFSGFFWDEIKGQIKGIPSGIVLEEVEVKYKRWKSEVDAEGFFNIRLPFYVEKEKHENAFEIFVIYHKNGEKRERKVNIAQKNSFTEIYLNQ